MSEQVISTQKNLILVRHRQDLRVDSQAPLAQPVEEGVEVGAFFKYLLYMYSKKAIVLCITIALILK
jgi:hypothetical protein